MVPWHALRGDDQTRVCICHIICIILCSISLVTEPEEFFNLMIQIMRTTKEEGRFTLTELYFDVKLYI